VEHFLEVLKILDGAVNADRGKVIRYAELLAEKLAASGDAKSAAGIRRTILKGKGTGLEPARLSPMVPVDGESRFALADEQYFARGDARIVLDLQGSTRTAEFIRHVRGSDKLLANGIGIAPSLLIYGPPGCGKSQLARYIASELGMPMLTARTDTLISSYLGSTAKNLRSLFEHAMGRPCVLFLDEFDAVAKLRDDQHELGELKRVVVSLLQNIDALDNKTILLAATNHEHLLDPAIWRRFAFRVQMALPTLASRTSLLQEFLGKHAPEKLELEHLALATDQMSGSDLRQLCEEARRSAILDGLPVVPDLDLLGRLARCRIVDLDSLPLPDRIRAVRQLSPKLFTVRRISELLAVSTGKVSTVLRTGEANEEG
jgi:hypothetical protein